MISATNTPPCWDTPAPADAVLTVVDALSSAGMGDVDGCCAVLSGSTVDPGWLTIVAVDILAALVQGLFAREWWDRMRLEASELAIETGASDWQLRGTLTAIALAEARQQGARVRVSELQVHSEFEPAELASIACQLAGMVAAHRYGNALFGKLQRVRRMYRDYGFTGSAVYHVLSR